MVLNYTEEAIQRALNAVANGMSQKKAGLEFGVPRSTLQNRINGILSRQEAHEHEQRLSPVQEDHLTQWVLTQEALGLAPTHAQIRALRGESCMLGEMLILLENDG